MRMGKLLNTLGPLPVPVVQTATAVLPPATEVKMSAPLSSFASASASKPVSANQDLWETIGQEGAVPLFDAIDPNSEITRRCSPTLPPTSLAASEKGGGGEGGGGDPPGDDPSDDNAPKGSDKPGRGRKDKGGKKPPSGSSRPRGGVPGDGDDDGDDDNDEFDDSDSDRKFVRRMRALFGTPKDPSTDKHIRSKRQTPSKCQHSHMPSHTGTGESGPGKL